MEAQRQQRSDMVSVFSLGGDNNNHLVALSPQLSFFLQPREYRLEEKELKLGWQI